MARSLQAHGKYIGVYSNKEERECVCVGERERESVYVRASFECSFDKIPSSAELLKQINHATMIRTFTRRNITLNTLTHSLDTYTACAFV